MRITNRQMISLLNEISALKQHKMPLLASRAIIKNLKTITENYQIYKEQLDLLFSSYGTKNTDGSIQMMQNGFPVVEQEKVTEFNRSLTELLNLESDILFELFPAGLIDTWDDDKYDPLTVEELEILCCMTSDSEKEA